MDLLTKQPSSNFKSDEKPRIYQSIMDSIGNTPYFLFQQEELPNVNLYIKHEGLNPSGSIKDRAATYNIKAAEENGDLVKGKTILDASSGNMACALAYYGRQLGYKVEVICNTKLTEDKKNFIEYFGATCTVHGDITVEGNRRCAEIMKTKEGQEKYCFLDQLHNWANPKASYETLGPEILKAFPKVAAVIGSMGSGGSMLGTSTFLREQSPNTKIFTSQAAAGTKIPGTGGFDDGDYITPFIQKMMDTGLYHDTEKVHQHEAEEKTIQLADQGIFVGFQGGGVVHAALACCKRHNIEGDVVAIMGDSGWKNMEKLQKLIKK